MITDVRAEHPQKSEPPNDRVRKDENYNSDGKTDDDTKRDNTSRNSRRFQRIALLKGTKT